MKFFQILLITSLFSFNSLYADFNIKVRLTFENELGAKYDKLVFGAVSGATDGIDEHLGEEELPPFVPPEIEILAFMNLDTLSAAGLYSYVDFRSVPEDFNDFFHQYRVVLFKRSNSLITISWLSLLPQIKSAFMADRFDGIMFKAQMKDTNNVTINNQFLDRIDFNIKVWYTKNNSSVKNNSSEIKIFPNPASKFLKIKAVDLEYKTIELYNSIGEMVGEYDINSMNLSINLEKYPSGMYFLVFRNDTTFYTKKLMIE